MKAAALAALVIVALSALVVSAWGSSRGADATEAATQAQAEQLEQALDQVERLEARTQELEAHTLELKADLAGVQEGRVDSATQLERVSGRLWESLGKLREALAEARSAGSSASSDAAAALGNASAAVRDLSILENRFEYHLRQHGGG